MSPLRPIRVEVFFVKQQQLYKFTYTFVVLLLSKLYGIVQLEQDYSE